MLIPVCLSELSPIGIRRLQAIENLVRIIESAVFVIPRKSGIKDTSIFGNSGIAKGYLKGPDSGNVTRPSSKMNFTATRAAVPTTSVHLS